MKVYHGTIFSAAMNIKENGVDLDQSKKMLDFGRGFYTTPNRLHAAKTAETKTLRYNEINARKKKDFVEEKPAVIEFEYNENKDLKIKVFENCDEEWMRFVVANRLDAKTIQNYNIVEHNLNQKYDIVQGHIADGDVSKVAATIRKGKTNYYDVNLLDLLKNNGDSYGIQISFHSKESLGCIEFKQCDTICIDKGGE